MSNFTVNFNVKPIDKIIIKDDSDDSFLSQKSISSKTDVNDKSLFNKYGKTQKNIVVKHNNKTTNNKNINKNYNKRLCNSIVNETKNILEKSYDSFQKSNEQYYNDVLEWMNMLYNDVSKSILRVQIKKITLNEDIFNKYNEIIKIYKLKKNLFNTELFDFNDNYDYDSIVEIAKIMTTNLIEKLNYKFDVINNGKSKKLKIKNLSKEI